MSNGETNPHSSLMQSHTQTNPALRKPDSLHFFRIVKEQPNKLIAARPARGCPAMSLENRVTGGANRDRTGDLLLAKQALSQLSYGPVGYGGSGWT